MGRIEIILLHNTSHVMKRFCAFQLLRALQLLKKSSERVFCIESGALRERWMLGFELTVLVRAGSLLWQISKVNATRWHLVSGELISLS